MRCTDEYMHKAAAILRRIDYATLATVTPDGRPWNSPVYAVKDSDIHIYWISDKEGQHSRNVLHSGRAFIVIYDSTIPEGTGEGVYIEATVEELDSPEEIARVRMMKKGIAGDPMVFMGDGVRRIYKATPERVWMNADEVEKGVFIRDYRIELNLADLQKTFRLQA